MCDILHFTFFQVVSSRFYVLISTSTVLTLSSMVCSISRVPVLLSSATLLRRLDIEHATQGALRDREKANARCLFVVCYIYNLL
jgi:hypothetical protein